MNSQVVRRKEASAGGLIRPLITYALLSFLPPAKESTSGLKKRDARARASEPVSAAASDLRPGQPGPAKQSGRGRHATSPWLIPWAGWKDILWRTYGQIGDDRLLAVAAGVVFYGLLAIFPGLQPLYRSTGYSLRRRRLAITFPSQQASSPAAGSKSFRSKSIVSRPKATPD